MGLARPRALHIAPAMPARGGNGLAMRQGLFLEALSRVCDAELVVLPVAGPAGIAPTLAAELGVPATIAPVAGRRDTQFELLSRIKDPAARAAAFAAYGRSSLAAGLSLPVLAELRQRFGAHRYDLVHIGRSYLADTLTALETPGAVTLDFDEDEQTSYREIAAGHRQASRHAAAAWAEAEATAISALIRHHASRVELGFVAGAPDAAAIGARHPGLRLEIVGNAIAMPPHPRHDDDGATLLFVGSFGYAPNVDAVRWFAEAIWPTVRATASRPPRLLIVGRDAAPDLLKTADHPGIEVLGEIGDIADAYRRATLVIAPLRAGAGTRLKLIEAAAHGVPIVATGLAARGLELKAPDHLWLADDPAAFAAVVLEALDRPAERAGRAALALELVRTRHDRDIAVDQLACRLAAILAR
ncbi:MAG: hypothetical protein JWQ89_2718 [Devosia sp.]|uniref:glycosyltransferase n=1 Tax=Devosia sp. TaxID=1871048 RepID=UPI0026150F12|nr:glycosyltransferase family 4 protein [Devosia sp.]MDB5540991.1 hypothetical protein [Devosia sp.]